MNQVKNRYAEYAEQRSYKSIFKATQVKNSNIYNQIKCVQQKYLQRMNNKIKQASQIKTQMLKVKFYLLKKQPDRRYNFGYDFTQASETYSHPRIGFQNRHQVS